MTISEPGEVRQSASETPGPQNKLRGRALFALMGPAIIVGAMQFGPGNYVSATTLGAESGFSYLWVFAVSAVLMFIFVDMGIRIGISLKRGPLDAVCTLFTPTVGKFVRVVVAIAFIVVEVLFLIGTLVGGAMGLVALFGGSVKMWSVVIAVVGMAVFMRKGAYKRLEIVMIAAMGVLVVVFFIIVVFVAPDVGAVAGGFVPSQLTGDGLTVFAALGTNLSMTAAFYAIYTAREKGTSKSVYRQTTLVDTVPGVFIPAVITMVMIIVAATVIPGQKVEDASDFVRILEVVASPGVAVWLFAIGILAASLSSVLGNAGITASAVSDVTKQGGKLQSRGTNLTIAAVITIGTIFVVIFGAAPVPLVILANSAVLLFFPLLAIAMLLLANSRAIMGDMRNGVVRNILAITGLIVVLYGSIQVGIELINQLSR